jgi:2-polyprenyl-6-methoxyphenol hydroxylase-like FAD-dependent oxidoreductase
VQDAESISAQISATRGVETLRARYLVGADGGGSLVRHVLDIGFPSRSLDVRDIVADAHWKGWIGVPGIGSRTERQIRYPFAR